MQRIQVLKNFEKADYQPPFQDRRFYLIKNRSRLVLINENPRIITDEPRYKGVSFVPVLHWICWRKHGPTELNKKLSYEFPFGSWTPNDIIDTNDKLINPSLIYDYWIEEVENVIGSQEPAPISRREYPDYSNVDEEDNDINDEETVKEEELGLIDMPLEVFEVLVSYLNAYCLLNISKVSEELGNQFWTALGTNPIKVWKFWRMSCFKICPEVRNMIVCSYDNVLNRESRLIPRADRPYVPFIDEMDSHTWKDVMLSFYNKFDLLAKGIAVLKNMDSLESKVKSYLQTIQEEKETDLTTKDIKMVFQTSGYISFFVLCPWGESNMRILEGLDEITSVKRARMCKNDIRYMKMMYLPTFKDESESIGPGLPRIERILISTCESCTCLRPLMDGGHALCINHNLDEAKFDYCKMDPIIAIDKDVFALWESPNNLMFYKCHKDNRNRLQADLLLQIRIWNGKEHWDRIANFTSYYVPILEKIPNNKKTKRLKKRLTPEEYSKDLYNFKLVSLRYGVDTIGCYNPHNPYDDGHFARLSDIEYQVLHQYPEYYLDNAMKYRNSLGICYSSAYNYGLFISWNNEALAISTNGIVWFFHSWATILDEFVEEFKEINVTHIDIIYKNGFIAAINGNVCGFQIKIHNSKDKSKEPILDVWATRILKMPTLQLGLEITQMTWDYDLGEPYIFLIMRKIDSDSAMNFCFKQLLFFDKKECNSTNVDVDLVASIKG